MKTVVVLVCALAAVTATPLFGTEQCANGPGVWCVNIRTAKQCSAVTHCQQAVWNKPVMNSTPCEICKEVVTVVGNFLKDNITQTETLALLNKACELLREPSLVSECKQLVAEYYPLVLNIIEQELSNPSVPCCALGLCKSLQQYLASLKTVQLKTNEIPDVDFSKMVPPFMANLPILLKPQEKSDIAPKNKDVCQDCIQLISDIQDQLKSNSSFSKMLVENLLKECDELGGGLSEMCKTYINQYAELAFQMAIQMTANEICSGAGLCTKASPHKDLIPAKVIVPAMKLQPAIKVAERENSESLPVCELCELVVQQVEKLLDSNRTRAHIKEALDKVCDLLPSKYSQKCKSFVETYADLVITLMETEGDPKIICMALGCCSSRKLQIVNLNSESCEVCKMIMTYLDSILGQNATKQKIEDGLQKICTFLPPSAQDQCHTLVTMYGPMILEMLLQKMDPGTVCVELNVCPGVQKHLLGTEKCMWGPSYWCKDLETAGSCNAIEHCKRHVWN